MKKILAILLSVLMLCSVIPFASVAADSDYYIELVADAEEVNAGDEIEFLSPEGLRNITLKLTEFEDASTGEISQKVSAGQGKSIRIKPSAWSLPIDEIKRLLPQYVIARKFSPLKDENRKMLDNKISEFNTLCND